MDQSYNPDSTIAKPSKSATNLLRLAESILQWRPRRTTNNDRTKDKAPNTTESTCAVHSFTTALSSQPIQESKSQPEHQSQPTNELNPTKPISTFNLNPQGSTTTTPSTSKNQDIQCQNQYQCRPMKSWDSASLTSSIFSDRSQLATQRKDRDFTASQVSLSRQTIVEGIVYYEDHGSVGVGYGLECGGESGSGIEARLEGIQVDG